MFLKNMETDTDLFETLLCSYPTWLRSVKKGNGCRTENWLFSLNNEIITNFLLSITFLTLMSRISYVSTVSTYESFYNSYCLVSISPIFYGLSFCIKFIITSIWKYGNIPPPEYFFPI